MAQDNHIKVVTGSRMVVDTNGGLAPVYTQSMPNMDANYSTVTMTADIPQTWGATTYAKGDVLFWSDGFYVRDSTGNTMNGWSSGDTGGIRALPQSVIAVRVPDSLATTVTDGEVGQFYWLFFNGWSNTVTSGVRVGLVNMAGNGGLGEFVGWASSGESSPDGIGVLDGTVDGICGRMASMCYIPDNDGSKGVVIITQPWCSGAGCDNNTINVNRLFEINTSTAFPKLSSASANKVISPAIIPTPANDAGADGTIKATITNPVTNMGKIATIIRSKVGTPSDAQGNPGSSHAVVVAYNIDLNTGIVDVGNSDAVDIGFWDSGPTPSWPIPSNFTTRFVVKELEWSHASTEAAGCLYFPDLDWSGNNGNGAYRMNRMSVSAGNGLVRSSVDILDNTGQQLWKGFNQLSPIPAGMWMDGQLSGRLFMNVAEVENIWTLAVTNSTDIWTTNYPEIYGKGNNTYQPYILYNVNDCDVYQVSPTGVLNQGTEMRWGRPSITLCGQPVPSGGDPDLHVTKCAPFDGFTLDQNNTLWESNRSGTGMNMNQVNTFALTNPIGIANDNMLDFLYIWDSPTGGTSLTYRTYHSKNMVTSSPQALAGSLADYGSHVDFVGASPLDSTVSGAQNAASNTCDRMFGLSKKTGAGELYSISAINLSANTIGPYNAAKQFDLASDFAGSLATKLPVGIAIERPLNNVDTNSFAYVAVDTSIIKFDYVAGTWSKLANTSATAYSSIWLEGDSVGPTVFKLYGVIGTPGNESLVEINKTTGANTTIGPLYTMPGSNQWPQDAKSVAKQDAYYYYISAPLRVTSADAIYPVISSMCNNTPPNIWEWYPHDTMSVGCWTCYEFDGTDHTLFSQWCEPGAIAGTNHSSCRACLEKTLENCTAFVSCCEEKPVQGPIELITVAINTTASYIHNQIYQIDPGDGTRECVTAVKQDDPPKCWISFNDSSLLDITNQMDMSNGNAIIPGWSVFHSAPNDLKDIAFDRNGNVIFSHDTQSLSWASAIPGFTSDAVNATNTFSVPQMLDYDYTVAGQVVGGEMIGGVATFNRYTLTVASGINLTSTITNATIGLGHDLSVDYNTGNYWVLGDQTGGNALNDLILVDHSTGNHTFISNLATVCSYPAGRETYGIETIRMSSNPADVFIYIISATQVNISSWNIFLHQLNGAGTTENAVVQLVNPVDGSYVFTSPPNGMAYNDFCQKWPNLVEPVNHGNYQNCSACLSQPSSQACCMKLTNCTDPTDVIYTQLATIVPYIGQTVMLASGNCYDVTNSVACPSPVSPALHPSTPGPYADCSDCLVGGTRYYKLVSCIDPTDILYTDDTLTPGISGAVGWRVVVGSELFCREVQINPTGPQGTEAAYTYTGPWGSCSECKFMMKLVDCDDPNNQVLVDYHSSTTLWPYIGLVNGLDINVGGAPLTGCWKVDSVTGPTSIIYPTATLNTAYADCSACNTAGITCFELEHCCGSSYVANQIVTDTSGVVAGDVGQVIDAEITVGGIVYSGCWTVSATSGPAPCAGALPDIDVNVLNSTSIGTPIGTDCAQCPTVMACNDCVLLTPCITGAGPDVTVDSATAAGIGTNAVTFNGNGICYEVCRGGSALHGMYWYYGDRLGINFNPGIATPVLDGGSVMTEFNTGPAAYATTGGFVHSTHRMCTIGGHTFMQGDLMFYTDGRYIYDRTHTEMLDSTGNPAGLLGGDPLNTGGFNGRKYAQIPALAVPNPASTKQNGVHEKYFLIYNTVLNGPIYWAEIDMTLNGGKGQITAATKNTVLVANAGEVMCTSNSTASQSEYYLYYRPIMANQFDDANRHIAGIKIDNTGFSAPFVAFDCPAGDPATGAGWLSHDDPFEWANGDMVVSPDNRTVAMNYCKKQDNQIGYGGIPMDYIKSMGLWSRNLADGKWTGPAADPSAFNTDGYNGGANNGTYTFLGGISQGPIPSAQLVWGSLTYTLDSKYVYGSFKPCGGGICSTIRRFNVEDALNTIGWNSLAEAGYTIRSKPAWDGIGGSSASGYYASNGDGDPTILTDIQVMPTGEIALCIGAAATDSLGMAQAVKVPFLNNDLNMVMRTYSHIILVTNPSDSNNANIEAQINMQGQPAQLNATYDLGNRYMGQSFPRYLFAPCPCDPANVVNITIDNTYPNCQDSACTAPPNDGYKITECFCTGGQSFNSCSVNDPATMPPYMAANGKTWSGTPQSFGGAMGRWNALVNAVQALGTTNAPGVNQTVTFTYSFVQGGSILDYGQTSSAVEQGPGTANPTGRTSGCAVYNKQFQITHAQFKTEIIAMFGYLKAMFEAVFNTSCGYGADLTVNFTDLGYESAPANFQTATMLPGNGTSFTDSNGVTGIGDLRIAFGPGPYLPCGGQGAQSGVLAYAVPPFNANDPGLVKANPRTGLLVFDQAEDWRKQTDAAAPLTFELVLIGIHEILHALGYGHDIKWDPFPCGDSTPGAGDGYCGCPSYQATPGCPSIYGGSSCGTGNSNAVMGPFASTQGFTTLFPTGLVGPEGIYERRATCGIYGNPSANYGCEDGVCIGGCVYVTHYSTDHANLAPAAGGIIEWDNGDAAGLRCWEVEYLPVMPSPMPTLTNPLVPSLVYGPGTDCTSCAIPPGNACWTLTLCPCTDPAIGAPATIVTDTDMSQYCNAVNPQLTVEIDLYPGACYEIDCNPVIPCPTVPAPVTVVITASHDDCTDCCSVNQVCYELCPCNNPSSNTCDSQALVSGGLHSIYTVPGTAVPIWQYITVNYAGTAWGTLKAESDTPNMYPFACLSNGNILLTYLTMNVTTGLGAQLPGMPQITYTTTNSWNDVLTDLIAAGYATPGDSMQDVMNNAAFQAATGKFSPMHMLVCSCQQACTTVTTDLSGNIGDIVKVNPGAPAPLDPDLCYIVGVCGQCTNSSGSCFPAGPVTISPPYADCQTCDNVNPPQCYKLVDCEGILPDMDNVCSTVDLDNAFAAGQIIQINGNVSTCWMVMPGVNCDPNTCNLVAVTATFASCALCTGSQQWECVGPCDCQPSAGPGYQSQAACLADPICCPLASDYECINGNCTPCAPTGCVAPPADQYASLALCVQNCAGLDPTYNCFQVTPGSLVYSCIDPGDGSGYFAGPSALADCAAAVAGNTSPCYIESWNCVTNAGVSTCIDPGDASGTWNDLNGGLMACASCNACPLDPTCTGTLTDPTYDCDPVQGCIINYAGVGAYPDLATCDPVCVSNDPEGEYETDCINCLTDPNMQALMEKVAEMCDDCNPPFGLEENELECGGCFGQSNIYVFLDMSSTFSTGSTSLTFQDKLQSAVNFKNDVIIPAYNQLKADNPSYSGHLYVIPGTVWPPTFASGSNGCANYNGSGAAIPANSNCHENWLEWAAYPLSGNAGANGPAPTPFTAGTLPQAKRTAFLSTMVDGINGAPMDCGTYIHADHAALIDELMILPGDYPTDGFTQVNPWADGPGSTSGYKVGRSDPYHEFQGGDTSAISIILQDECSEGYTAVANNNTSSGNNWNSGGNPGTCGAPLWNALPTTEWHYGLSASNSLTAEWKTNYNSYMELHQYGWDVNGNPGTVPRPVTTKVVVYAGSAMAPSSSYPDSKRDFHYHLYQAIGGGKGEVDAYGHIQCSDYVPVPAVFDYQCWAATDPSIPNMYMGASGGGDPTHTTGYLGGSLSNYDISFKIPEIVIQDLDSDELYNVWVEYLSDC